MERRDKVHTGVEDCADGNGGAPTTTITTTTTSNNDDKEDTVTNQNIPLYLIHEFQNAILSDDSHTVICLVIQQPQLLAAPMIINCCDMSLSNVTTIAAAAGDVDNVSDPGSVTTVVSNNVTNNNNDNTRHNPIIIRSGIQYCIEYGSYHMLYCLLKLSEKFSIAYELPDESYYQQIPNCILQGLVNVILSDQFHASDDQLLAFLQLTTQICNIQTCLHQIIPADTFGIPGYKNMSFFHLLVCTNNSDILMRCLPSYDIQNLGAGVNSDAAAKDREFIQLHHNITLQLFALVAVEDEIARYGTDGTEEYESLNLLQFAVKHGYVNAVNVLLDYVYGIQQYVNEISSASAVASSTDAASTLTTNAITSNEISTSNESASSSSNEKLSNNNILLKCTPVNQYSILHLAVIYNQYQVLEYLCDNLDVDTLLTFLQMPSFQQALRQHQFSSELLSVMIYKLNSILTLTRMHYSLQLRKRQVTRMVETMNKVYEEQMKQKTLPQKLPSSPDKSASNMSVHLDENSNNTSNSNDIMLKKEQ